MPPELQSAVTKLEQQGANHADVQAFITQHMQSGSATANQQQGPYQPQYPAQVGGGASNFGSLLGNIPGSTANLANNMIGSWSKAGATAASIGGGVAGAAAGGVSGGTIGAFAGGALGSIIGPEGTVAGAAIGDALGTAIGGYAGSWLGSITANSVATGQNPWNEMHNIAQSYHQKYFAGGVQGAAQQIVNDPVGSALDFSIALDGFGSITKGIGDAAASGVAAGTEAGAKTGAESAIAPKPNAMQTAGSSLQSVAGMVNPITAPFKLLGSTATTGGGTAGAQAAERVGQTTGVDVQGSMTSGAKQGGFLPVIEAAVSFLPGGKGMVSKIQNMATAVQTAQDTFGTQLVTSLQGKAGGLDVNQAVEGVAQTIVDQHTANKEATNALFGEFVNKPEVANAPIDPSSMTIPTAFDDKGNATNMTSLSGLMSHMQSDTSLTPAFRRIAAGLSKDLFGGASEADKMLAEIYGQDAASLTPEARARALAAAGVKDQGTGITFQKAFNIGKQLDTLFKTTPQGPNYVALTKLDQALTESMGQALKNTDPQSFQTWQQIKNGVAQASQAVGDNLYQKVLTGVKNDSTKSGTFLEQVFGKNSSPSSRAKWEQVMGEDNFQKMGFGYLMKQVQDSYSGGNMESGSFDARKFSKALGAIPDSKWQQMLGTDGLQFVQWAKTNTSDFTTIMSGIKHFDRFTQGSPTGPLSQVYKLFNKTLTPITQIGEGAGLAGAGYALFHGLGGGFLTLAGEYMFSKFVGSDIGQAFLSESLGSGKVSAIVQGMKQALQTGMGTGAATQSNLQTQGRNTLSTQQLMNLMKTIQQNPEQASTIIQQGQQQGYWIPPQLLNMQSQ